MNRYIRFFRFLQKKSAEKRIASHIDDYGVEKVKDIAYMNDSDSLHLLDIYYPKEQKEKLPVIIEVHGGAYVSNTKDINTCHAQYLATKGYAVVNMSYTLYPEDDMRQAVREIFVVREWIETHADQYRFDTKNVFLTGDSAGGHMVIMAGGVLINDNLRKYVGMNKVPLQFRAIAATCPMGELDNLRGVNAWILKKLLKDLLKNESYISNVCYKNFITTDFPPLFILTTTDDDVLYEHTRCIHEWLKENGVSHEYKEYHSRKNRLEHVFNIMYPWYEESVEANNDIITFFENNLV